MPDFQNDPEGMPELEAKETSAPIMDRRGAVKTLAAAAALLPIVPLAAQQAEHTHHAASTAASAYTPQLIKGAQRDLLTAVCDRIIPRTDTPGAADVGVADEIDWMATRRRSLMETVAKALARVEKAAGKSFLSLSAGGQDAVLRTMSANLASEDGKAFLTLKELTIDGYYRTKGGLMEELGWNGNTYLPEFKGCTHEHAPVARTDAPGPEVAG